MIESLSAPLAGILARIVETKRKRLDAVRGERHSLEARASALISEKRGFASALAAGPPAIIAESKKASPSRGVLMHGYDPAGLASAYESGGAAAISVLTDEEYFQGSLDDMRLVRAAVSLPVLRKDFTLEPFDVAEAAAHGADALLLIAALHSSAALRQLRELAEAFHMDVLVEVHDQTELDRAIDSGARIIGVNNRDLRTFEVSLETSLRLAERMPPGVLTVSESGIHSRADVESLSAAGYRAFLVGEHLVKSGDPAAQIGALRGFPAAARP